MERRLQDFSDPPIQTFACQFCLNEGVSVQLGGQADKKPAGKGLFRRFATLSAKVEIIIDGFLKRSLNLLNGGSFKRNHIADVDYFTMQDTCFLVEFNFADIAFVFHLMVLLLPLREICERT